MISQAPLTVAWASLGCPKNLVDSEKMLAHLAQAGLVVAAPMDQAEVIVVNTCGFLSAARDESLGVIAEALEHKRRGRAKRVVVAGCLVNRDGGKLFEQAQGIDAIVGVHNRRDILKAVLGGAKVLRVRPQGAGKAPSDRGRLRLTPRHTAYLRISEGCSQRCTFCTIPLIRGPLRSKPVREVLAEAKELISDGAVELNLIGQDTTAYGTDWRVGDGRRRSAPSLAGLLRKLDALPSVRWLRLMYAYPNRFDDELIETIASSAHVVPYLDIPLQHICSRVLKRMGRGVTRRQIELLIERLRRRIKALVLRTTFIVGFPGESEQEFRELLSFLRQTRFDRLGVFAFSPEPPAAAARMRDQVSDGLKARRSEALMLAQQEIAFEANRAKLGSRIEVLVDSANPKGQCVGRYYGQAPDIDGVCILTESRPAGSFVQCRAVGWKDYDLVVEPT